MDKTQWRHRKCAGEVRNCFHTVMSQSLQEKWRCQDDQRRFETCLGGFRQQLSSYVYLVNREYKETYCFASFDTVLWKRPSLSCCKRAPWSKNNASRETWIWPLIRKIDIFLSRPVPHLISIIDFIFFVSLNCWHLFGNRKIYINAHLMSYILWFCYVP